MIFNIQYTKENLHSNTGLALFSNILDQVNPQSFLRHYGFTNQSTEFSYSDRDVLIAYLGLMLCGQNNFEHIDFYRNDNTGSKKQGVSQTYRKKIEGFAPMMTNIGRQGYLLNLDFRQGRRHSNCPGTNEYIMRCMNLARRLCPNQPLLARFDLGNDADSNIVALSSFPNSFYIIKHLQRGKNAHRLKDTLIQEVMANFSSKHILPGNAVYYNWEKESLASIINENGHQVIAPCRKILSVVEITHDINTGAPLLLPYRCLHMWRTNLPIDQYSPEQVIERYKDHGTSEQFHSEFKSALDVERMPSSKFLTNKLIMQLAKIAFNVLRIIGHQALDSKLINPKKNKSRIRIRTVLLKIMFLPSKLIRKHKRWTVVLPRSNPLSQVFELSSQDYISLK